MDSLTQAILGAAVGEATLDRQVGRKAALWGGVFGTLPDLDVLVNPFVSEMQALAIHRGLSHSLFFAVVAAPIAGAALHRLHRREPASRRGWIALVFLALITHILLDCFTSYGTQVFQPFSNYPVIFSTVFIIDPLYTVPLALGLLAALRSAPGSRQRLWFNSLGLGLSTAYLLLTGINKLHIEATFRQALVAQGHAYERLFTTPTPFNNLLWTGIAADAEGFWIGLYSLLDGDRTIRFERVQQHADRVAPFEGQLPLERLRWFSRGYFTVSQAGNTLSVHDLRFGRTDLWLQESGAYLFTFRLRRAANHPTRLTGFAQDDPRIDLDTDLLRRFVLRILGIERQRTDQTYRSQGCLSREIGGPGFTRSAGRVRAGFATAPPAP